MEKDVFRLYWYNGWISHTWGYWCKIFLQKHIVNNCEPVKFRVVVVDGIGPRPNSQDDQDLLGVYSSLFTYIKNPVTFPYFLWLLPRELLAHCTPDGLAQAPEKYGGHQTHGCTVSVTVASSIWTFRVDVSCQECQARGTGADMTTLRPQPGIPGFGDYWKCGRMQRSISGKPTQIVTGFSRKQN